MPGHTFPPVQLRLGVGLGHHACAAGLAEGAASLEMPGVAPVPPGPSLVCRYVAEAGCKGVLSSQRSLAPAAGSQRLSVRLAGRQGPAAPWGMGVELGRLGERRGAAGATGEAPSLPRSEEGLWARVRLLSCARFARVLHLFNREDTTVPC